MFNSLVKVVYDELGYNEPSCNKIRVITDQKIGGVRCQLNKTTQQKQTNLASPDEFVTTSFNSIQ